MHIPFDKVKVRGSLYGFAIGDAMGATTEFMSEEEIQKRYGKVTDIIGGGWLDIEPGEVTDDTQMMLCVCDAIENTCYEGKQRVHNVNFYEFCCRNFVNWYDDEPIDIGNCCRNVINHCRKYDFKEWVHFAFNPNSLGNGSLMRTLPTILANLSVEQALIQGKLTHNNNVCDKSISEYYCIVQEILLGEFHMESLQVELMEPTGHIVNTLNNAKYWFTHTNTVEDAITLAVNHGGDADTIAAITGSLVGAYYGFENIPKKWINKLKPNIASKLDRYTTVFVQ